MYKPSSVFVFPHLTFLKDVSFKSWSEQNKTTKLYKLDWDSFDCAILKRYIEWNEKYWPGMPLPFIHKFDDYYENLLQSLKFAIPNHYLTEIRRVTQKALLEWNQERHFDTCVRDMCLGPAIKFIQVAFRLIADCTYDENTNYFFRANNKYLLDHMLMFRFWQHQTGSGNLEDHSDFDKLKSKLNWLKSIKNNPENWQERKNKEIASLERFLEHFKNQCNKIDKALSDNVKMAFSEKAIIEAKTEVKVKVKATKEKIESNIFL